MRLACALAFGVAQLLARGNAPAGDLAGADTPEFFESKVRPLLVERCQGCHGPQKQRAGLRLDSRQGMMRGGDAGLVVAPGKPDASRLVEVIRYDGDIRMPPQKKLSDHEIAVLTEWVRRGAR